MHSVFRRFKWSILNNNLHSFFDDHPSQHFVPSNTILVGLCTGLLAAAAVSASQSALDLIDNALKIVRVAFRIGIRVNDAAQRLSTDVNQSWSRLVVGVQKEASIAEVRQFNERKVRLAFSYLLFSPGSEILRVQPMKIPKKSGRRVEAVIRTWRGEE